MTAMSAVLQCSRNNKSMTLTTEDRNVLANILKGEVRCRLEAESGYKTAMSVEVLKM
ncbi:hypothetical protein J6590_050680 [Homalodisca vitripennis]|nr:hypothetical protein J6590_050680 [Homalodisca vitripennis]